MLAGFRNFAKLPNKVSLLFLEPRAWTRKSRENRGRSRLGRLERLLSCQERILGCRERILGCHKGVLGCQEQILGCREQILSMPGTDSGLLGLPGRHSALPGSGFWIVRKRTKALFEDTIRSHEARVSKLRAS